MPSINGIASSVDVQSGPIKSGVIADMSGSKVMAQDKAGSPVSSTPTADDSHQGKTFDHVLSKTTPAQAQDTKKIVTKAKSEPDDPSAVAKSEAPSSPDIGLLMSLLPALPQAASTPTADGPATAPAALNYSGKDAPAPLSPLGPVVAAPVAETDADADALQSSPADTSKAPNANLTKTEPPAAVMTAAQSTLDDKAAAKTDSLTTALSSVASSMPTPMISAPVPQAAIVAASAAVIASTPLNVLSEVPVTHQEWPTALGHGLLWTIGEGMQKAEISVSPQDMGPINVHIRIENDKTDIRFTATHAITREALEASIPRLRDMFSQQGLNLTQAQVFSQGSHDSKGGHPTPNRGNSASFAGNARDEPESVPTQARRWRSGLVDDYA